MLEDPVDGCFASCSQLPSAFGQSTFGTIQGTIRDASDAVIPNAMVTVPNVGTNVSLVILSKPNWETMRCPI